MTRKKTNKKWPKRKSTGQEAKSQDAERLARRIPLTSLFKGEEIQEMATILQIEEPNETHSFLGAVVLTKYDTVKRLLRDGYSIDCSTEDGTSAIMWAIQLNHWEMLELLVKRGGNLQQENKQGNTALLVAVQAKQWTQEMFLDFWNLVKEQNAVIDHQNNMGITVVHYVVRRQWEQALEILIATGANVNKATNKGVTPIMLACSRHQVKMARNLLAHSADVTLEDKKGCTAYCYSIAYFIQKRITNLKQSCLYEMLDLMKTETTKISMKTYLQRRLQLLQDPPVEKFHKTVTSVIVHIFTFFMRFVTEGVTILLQLNIFKALRNAIENHLDDKDYLLGLLNIASELIRQCDCCMQHVPWDDVLDAFNEAGILYLCLRILKKLESTSDMHSNLHATFLPLFLTCKNPITQLWLQKNYKIINHFYRVYSQAPYLFQSVYPDEQHTEFVKQYSLYFESLMRSLQNGQEISRSVNNRRQKVVITQKPCGLQNSQLKAEKNSVCKGATTDFMNTDETLRKVIDSKKGLDREIPNEINTNDWPLMQFTTNAKESLKEITEKYKEKRVYSKWEEEYKEGCKLFGISFEEDKTESGNHGDQHNSQQSGELSTTDINPTLKHLEGLFCKILYLIEISWQRDFSNGYADASLTVSVADLVKLMNNLPNMEIYHWLMLNRKWLDLRQSIKLYWEKNINNTTEEIERYLEDTISYLSTKLQLTASITEQDVLKGFSKNVSYLVSLKEFGYEQEDIPIYQIGSYSDFKTGNQDTLNLSQLSSYSVHSRSNLDENKYSNSNSLYSTEGCIDNNYSNDYGNELKNEETAKCKSKQCHIFPEPPGIINSDEIRNTIYEENWRQVEFFRDKHEGLLSELDHARLCSMKQRRPLGEIVLPISSAEAQFTIGSGGSMGPVILGLDTTTAKPLAVKRLAYTESIAQQMRSQKVCALMRRLKNIQAKSIVPYTHCIELDQYVLIATPLCQQNLDTYIASLKHNNCFSQAKAKSMVKQALNGIYFLHTQDPPIIHGNLKPNNILIDASGRLRLSEFGIYKILYQQICPSTESSKWWSRETYWNYQGDWNVMITSQSDIQVIGMISHYILSGGIHPFGLNASDIARSVLTATPILRLDEPDSMDLVSWMISCNPCERPIAKQIMTHIFNWNKNKKWKFLLICAGVTHTNLPILQLHASIDKLANQHCINTKWIDRLDKKFTLDEFESDSKETPSSLLRFFRNNLPSSSRWFLPTFPTFPFILYRLLEGSYWFNYPDLAYFMTY